MTDVWHEDAIDLVHTKLDELLGSAFSYTVDGRANQRDHRSPPSIYWLPAQPKEGCGKLSGVKSAGGNPTPVGLDKCLFAVRIWHTSRQNCRATLHNLINAARQSDAKNSVKFLGYDFPKDANADQGSILEALCEVEVVVVDAVAETVVGEDLTIGGGVYDESVEPPELVATDTIPPVT